MVARRRRSRPSFSFPSRSEEVGVNRRSAFREDAKTSLRALERLLTTRFNLTSVDEVGGDASLGLPSAHRQSVGHLSQIHARTLAKRHKKQIPRDETKNGAQRRRVYERKGRLFQTHSGFNERRRVNHEGGRGNKSFFKKGIANAQLNQKDDDESWLESQSELKTGRPKRRKRVYIVVDHLHIFLPYTRREQHQQHLHPRGSFFSLEKSPSSSLLANVRFYSSFSLFEY